MRKPAEFANHPIAFTYAQDTGMSRAVCKHVTDGDTYDFFIDLGFNQYAYETVRLRGLDTPEIFRPSSPAEREHGLAARDRAIELLLDKPVLLKSFRDVESFGRYVADIGIVTTDPLTVTDLAGVLASEGFERKASY